MLKRRLIVVDFSKTLNRDGATFSLPVAKQGRTCSSIKALEHVQIEVSLSFFRRAFILMYLQSPAGTKSQMLYHRRFDSLTKERQYQDLTITSMHFWGEDPNAGNGEWKVLLNQAYFYKSRQGKNVANRNTYCQFYPSITHSQFKKASTKMLTNSNDVILSV